MAELFVTNKNDFVHEDRYAGEDYVFPPNEKVLISEAAAEHMFGFGKANKTDTLARLGWANPRPGEEPEAGVKKLARFVFTRGVVVEVPAEPEEEAAGAEAA